MTIFPKLHSPSPPGRNFQTINTVTPPVPQDINVATTADPMAFASPASLTDAYSENDLVKVLVYFTMTKYSNEDLNHNFL